MAPKDQNNRSLNPHTLKELARRHKRSASQEAYEKFKSADNEAKRRKLTKVRDTPAYQAASEDQRQTMLNNAVTAVEQDR